MSVETFNPSSAVSVTESARKHFLNQIAQEEKKGMAKGVRLSIKESGCTGYMYVVEIVAEPVEGDITVALDDNYALFVAPDAISVVQGTEIDLTKEGVNQVLTFKNPNVVSECGCGESFSIN